MGILKMGGHLVLFDESRIMSAPGFSFTIPHPTSLTHILYYNTGLIQIIDIFLLFIDTHYPGI